MARSASSRGAKRRKGRTYGDSRTPLALVALAIHSRGVRPAPSSLAAFAAVVVACSAGAARPGAEAAPTAQATACQGPTHTVEPLWKLATSGVRGAECAKGQAWTGTAAPGAACAHPTECRPVCCACVNGGASALTAWCDEGKCATPEAACCALAGTATYSCGQLASGN
jgi:hypothetical protein